MMHPRELQRAAYALARDQEGVLTREQLIRAGAGRGMIRSWSETGRLLPVYRSVHSLGRPVDSIEGWWMAAVLAAGGGAALAGFSATKALGFGRHAGIIEVARASGRTRRLEPRIRPGHWAEIRTVSLLPKDLTMVGPVPVMTTSRALLDIAGRSSPAQLRREFIEAGRHDRLNKATLDECRARGEQFRNHSRLVWLVDAWESSSGRIRSSLEGEFRIFSFERNLPPHQTNVKVQGIEVDVLFESQNVIVELDSRQFHGDGIAFEDDRRKSNLLTAHGYIVMRITWKMLKEDPDGVERLVRQALQCT